MRFLDLTLPALAHNLALDEALLLDAEAGGSEVLRLWEWRWPAVVLGAGGRIADDVHVDACAADGVPILRRSSGGGTVLLGPGCLLYSLVLSFDRAAPLTDLHGSYRYILQRIMQALAPFAAPLSLQGSSDLAWHDRKFSGNSQQRKRTHLLHHGTLLYAFDPAPVSRYLTIPPRRPAYRSQRTHAEFLANLPITMELLAPAVQHAWHAEKALPTWPKDLVARLVAEKYATAEWTHRR